MPPRWLLFERAQRVFLAVSGALVFVVGAALLGLSRGEVDQEIRLYAWSDRIEELPVLVRAVAWDRKERRMTSVALCDQPGREPLYALPLDLKLQVEGSSAQVCLQTLSLGPRNLRLALPEPRSAREHARELVLRETGVILHEGYEGFPFAHMAVPEGGAFNPREPRAGVLLWIDLPEGATLAYGVPGGDFRRGHPGPDGLYRIPLHPRVQDATATVEVRTGGSGEGGRGAGVHTGRTYRYQLRFGLEPREMAIDARWEGREVVARVRALDRSLGRSAGAAGGAPGAMAGWVFCTILLGRAEVESVQVPLGADGSATLRLSLPPGLSPDLPFVLTCDPDELERHLGASAVWVLPRDPSLLGPGRRKALLPRLAERLGEPSTARIRGWLGSEDAAARRRAVSLITASLRPDPTGPTRVASSFAADEAEAAGAYSALRTRVFVGLVVMLTLWLAVAVYALRVQRNARGRAMEEYLAFSPETDDLAAEFALRGSGALARPGSTGLVVAVLAVLILNILGVLWVLWAL